VLNKVGYRRSANS